MHTHFFSHARLFQAILFRVTFQLLVTHRKNRVSCSCFQRWKRSSLAERDNRAFRIDRKPPDEIVLKKYEAKVFRFGFRVEVNSKVALNSFGPFVYLEKEVSQVKKSHSSEFRLFENSKELTRTIKIVHCWLYAECTPFSSSLSSQHFSHPICLNVHTRDGECVNVRKNWLYPRSRLLVAIGLFDCSR